ncbi:hypothetical protein HBA54_04210 [Pelagibius litoralis]|uniref:Terminase n=1 Tax=Pelagibius litoralis TaxID=374515 RepID=A0A967C1R9_9PROT|nr:hypothetical protein [Pelagibius litoralis]NIA67786.1 hypothetical protein [Pelagibius litoralis]
MRAYEVAHRRWGKDDIALHWTATAAHQRIGTYWHMLPEAAQARKAIWEAINPHTGKARIDEAFPMETRQTTRGNEMFIKFKCGSTWQVVGSDNYNSLVGAPPVGLVLSEWALADPNAWTYLQPILEENGGWAVFITTPRGRNHAATFYEACKSEESWFVERSTAKDTDVFSQEQLDRVKREYIANYGDDGEARFRQEYLCSFDAGVVGAYYAKEMQAAEDDGRISGVPYDPAAQVHTAWDLGIGDSTAIWFFQTVGRELHLIDYIERSGVGLDHYAKLLKERPYVYGDHILPHDAEAKELGSGKSRVETLEALGIKSRIAPRLSVDDGIQASRALLSRCWIDQTKCKRGIDALRQYRREWDDKLKIFKSRPLHDWASHGSDAFRYLAVGLEEKSPARAKKRRPGRSSASAWMGA